MTHSAQVKAILRLVNARIRELNDALAVAAQPHAYEQLSLRLNEAEGLRELIKRELEKKDETKSED